MSEGTIAIISGAIVVSALIALRWVPTAPVPERNTGAGRSTAPRLPSSARPDQLTIFLALFVVIGFTFTPLIFLFDVALLTVAALQPLLNVASTSMSLSPRGANFLDGAVSLVVLVLWWASIRFTGRGRFLTTEIVHRIPGERTSRKHVVIAAILLAIGYASFKATMWFLAPMSQPF